MYIKQIISFADSQNPFFISTTMMQEIKRNTEWQDNIVVTPFVGSYMISKARYLIIHFLGRDIIRDKI